jgi:hypothetical protein
MKKIALIIIPIFVWMISLNAQSNIDLKQHYASLKAGQIVTAPQGIFDYGMISLSSTPYDLFIVGVIKPDMKYDNPRLMPNPVQKEGCIKVMCNAENGMIKKGDLVTSSSTPGVAMKATKAGMVLGIATDDATENGWVTVRLSIQYGNPKE